MFISTVYFPCLFQCLTYPGKSRDNAQQEYKGNEKSPENAEEESETQKLNDEMQPKLKNSSRRSKSPSNTDRQVKFSENEAKKYVYEAQVYEEEKTEAEEVPTIIIDDAIEIEKKLQNETSYQPEDNHYNISESTSPDQVSSSNGDTAHAHTPDDSNTTFESYHSSIGKEIHSPSHGSETKSQEEEESKKDVAEQIPFSKNVNKIGGSSSPTAKKVRVIKRKGSSRRKGQIMDDSTRNTLFRLSEGTAGEVKDEQKNGTYKKDEPVEDSTRNTLFRVSEGNAGEVKEEKDEPVEDDENMDKTEEEPTFEIDPMEYPDLEPIATSPSTENYSAIPISPVSSYDPSAAVETNNNLPDSQNEERKFADEEVNEIHSNILKESEPENHSSTYSDPSQADKQWNQEVNIPSSYSGEVEREDLPMSLLDEITSSLNTIKDDVLPHSASEQDPQVPTDYTGNVSSEEHLQTDKHEYAPVEDSTLTSEDIYKREELHSEHKDNVHIKDLSIPEDATIRAEDYQDYVDPDSDRNQVAHTAEIPSEELHTRIDEEEVKEEDEGGSQDSPTNDKSKKKVIKKIIKKKVNLDEGYDRESPKLVRKPTVRKKVVRKKLPE